MAFAFGLATEIERNLISERTKASLANIKASGKKLGRPLNATSRFLKLSGNIQTIDNLLANGVPKSQIAKIMHVQRNTLNRFIAKKEAGKLFIEDEFSDHQQINF